MDSNLALYKIIANHIAASPQQRITFAQYMDLALYHPEHGYYSTKAVDIGERGDFFTSTHLGADFGELLAVQFAEMWQVLGQPETFNLVEMGAGQGILSTDILKYLHKNHSDVWAALEYIIVEKSPGLQKLQQQRLQNFPVRWCSLEEIPSNSVTGCLFSNELVDAFGVHQFTLQGGELGEIYVTTTDLTPQQSSLAEEGIGERSEFVEVVGEPSTPRLAEYFDINGVNLDRNVYQDGYRSEVNLAALDWLSQVADRLQRGYVLTIDYGYPAHRYYNPMRSQGTLQCYYRHRHHNDPYINIGYQDITAHVDFTALERWGELQGLQKLAFIKQAEFLMALGMGERISAIATSSQPLPQLLGRRQALHQLIDPSSLGGFGVLLQGKALTVAQTVLKGFTIPELNIPARS